MVKLHTASVLSYTLTQVFDGIHGMKGRSESDGLLDLVDLSTNGLETWQPVALLVDRVLNRHGQPVLISESRCLGITRGRDDWLHQAPPAWVRALRTWAMNATLTWGEMWHLPSTTCPHPTPGPGYLAFDLAMVIQQTSLGER